MTTVTLGEGLEEIRYEAHRQCTSLQRIIIPPGVKTIDDSAFEACSNITNVEFCDKVEEFVSCEAMKDWWNQGEHEKSLSTYCLLVRYSIPERFGDLALVSSWQVNIYEMMTGISNVSAEGMNAYFASIDSNLTVYGNLLNEAPVLFPGQLGLDYGTVLIYPSCKYRT